MRTNPIHGLLISTFLVVAVPAFAEGMLPAMTGTTSMGASLVDAKGMTLYTFETDTEGKSMCDDACAAAWPPLAAADDAVASGEWTIVVRSDGTRMWAFKGHPLYTFVEDKAAGDVMGDAKNGFHLANLTADAGAEQAGAMMGVTAMGNAWVDAHGMALYTFENDADGKSMCNDACAVEWPPLAASADAVAFGELTIISRDDGSRMWALKGMPLYTFVDDKVAGEVTGDNVDGFHLAM